MRLRLLTILAAATVGIGSASAYAATLGVGSWHLWTGSQTLTKATCTVTGSTAINDTYVQEASPNANNANTTTAIIRSSTSGSREWMFIRFDLTSCALPTTAGADTATMKLVVKTTPATARTLTVTPTLSTWAETLTWNQAQSVAYGGAATTTFSTGTTNGATLNVPVTIDIDALIKSSTANFGWRISDAGASSTSTTTFNTVEATTAALRPQLVINYEK
jgi:hypothetical protein